MRTHIYNLKIFQIVRKHYIYFKYLLSLNKFKDITFQIASDPKDLEGSYKLRFDVYCIEKSYLDPSLFPDRLETDFHDELNDTTNIVAKNERSEIIGLVRIVPNGKESLALPSERYFPLTEYRKTHKDIAELTRFIIRSDYRNNIAVLFGLIKTCQIYGEKRGICNFCISTSSIHIGRYSLLGFQKISGPYYYSRINHEHHSVTMCINLSEAREQMKVVNPAFASYLAKKTPEIKI